MPEPIYEVGDETLIEIKNTEVCDIPYIKILTNNKYWCIVCCQIGHMGMEQNKLFSNINAHCKTKKHRRHCEVHQAASSELKSMTSHEFHKSFAEALSLDNIPFEKISKGSATKKWTEGHTGNLLFSPTHYRSNILPEIVESYKKLPMKN